MTETDSTSTKRCSKCDETKALNLFKRDRTHRDGHGSLCRPCDSRRQQLLYAAKPKTPGFVPCDGRSKTPEYPIWQRMIQRCNPNPKSGHYRWYGSRGISVCPEWRRSFAAFLRDVGPRPASHLTLDRIDNDGNYEPGNVRWATRLEQAANRPQAHNITIDGVTRTQAEWARWAGMSPPKLCVRLQRGMPIEVALGIAS